MNKSCKQSGLVSIIVPVYNVEIHLKHCIESILNQTYQNWELLLVNDGSNDNSYEICCKYAKSDSRIQTFTQNNSGVSTARNVGIQHASGDYMTFVDADDYLQMNAVEIALRYLVEAEADVVTYGWYRRDENGKLLEKEAENNEILDAPESILYRMLEHFNSCGGGYPWNKLWKTSSAASTCLFDPKLYYFEDLEWCVRMILRTKKLVICPECLYNYSILPVSVTNSIKARERREIGYHQSMTVILEDLQNHPNLASWVAKSYYLEIINGILFAMKNRFSDLYAYLLSRFHQNKKDIKAACKISHKMMARYFYTSLLSVLHQYKRIKSNASE